MGIWKRPVPSAKRDQKGSYDVVHVQSFKDAKYEIPLYCKNKKYIPRLVHTVHNLLPHEASAGDRELYSRFYNCCDLLVVHNEYCRQLLMKEYKFRRKRSVLPLMEAIPRSEKRKIQILGLQTGRYGFCSLAF